MPAKGDATYHANILGPTGLNAKSITGLEVWREAQIVIIEINYTGGPYYLKVGHNRLEYGGTSDWNTGTKIS